MQAENKKNNIKTLSLGCRLNALEAEKIQSFLAPALDCAILVNTCAVTAEAERQSGQAVRKLARENPTAPIFVTGCAATRNADLFANIPNSMVIPNANKMNPDAYADALANAPCDFSAPRILKFNHPAPKLSKQFIQVQNGCNHDCTYCVTRLLRGAAFSFSYDDILADARQAVENGFYEIVLTGVDTASYARDGMLISDVCAGLLRDVPGIQRLRISSFDPASPQVFKIIDLMHNDKRMMPHMHLSMQSGSDEILRAMRRRHTADTVRKIVQELRPIKIHAFPFSARPGTVAAGMSNQINRAVAKQRVHEISAIADKFRSEFMASHIGQFVPVLVEERNAARTPHDITVKINGAPILPRTIDTVKLIGVCGDGYIGECE